MDRLSGSEEFAQRKREEIKIVGNRITRREFLARTALAGAALSVLSLPHRRLSMGPAEAEAQVDPAAFSKFRAGLKGHLILPGDEPYERARRVHSWNPTTSKRPAAIVRCASRSDVVRAIEFARTHNLEVAVRGGGNDILGKSVCDGGLVIDLSPMKGLTVDSKRHLARAEAGLTSGELDRRAEPFGLAPGLSCNPAVGVSGLTLGGGMGWFVGKNGAACDNLTSVEIVTADGQMLTASEQENPELFWGLRGGGGNFGVATAFEYRLHPVSRILGGSLAYRGTQVSELLRVYRDLMRTAPDELTVELGIFVINEPFVFATICYAGDLNKGEKVLKPLRSFGPPLADSVRAMPYMDLLERPPLRFGLALLGLKGSLAYLFQREGDTPPSNYWKAGSLLDLSDEAIERMVLSAAEAPKGWAIVLGHCMRGAVSRVGPSDTALVRESGGCSYGFSVNWRDAKAADSAMGWVNRSWQAMQPLSSRKTYINYLSVDTEAAVKAAYGDNYGRLIALKNKYDPTNFFHLNRNIRPTGIVK